MVAYSADAASICQEAMFLLRQDVTVPADATGWNANTPIEWVKVRTGLETAISEVVDAFRWRAVVRTDNLNSWPRKVRNACVYCIARECSVPIAGRTEDMKNFDGLYRQKLLEAKLTDLNDYIIANEDPVFAQLVSNFRADDPAMVTAYEVYTQRVWAVRQNAEQEVRKTLSLGMTEPFDAVSQSAVNALIIARLAPACGGDGNAVQVLMQEYMTKVQEWRKLKLNEWLATNTDPVLSQLVANFKTDDTGLLNVQTVYTQRANTVKTVSDATVKDMLGVSTLSGISQEASYCLSVAKLAPACGLDANFVNLKMQEYNGILLECKRRELDRFIEEKSGVYLPCAEEVCKTLGISSIGTDSVALSCAVSLTQGRNGERYGYDTNYCNLKMQEYQAKVQEWRKVKLNESLATNTDPILTELMFNFRSDDAGLANAFAVYTQRVANAKTISALEINNAHSWTTAFTETSTTHVAYPAFVELVCSKLALACGTDANWAGLFEQKYQAKVREARVADLDAAKAALTDADTKQVMSMITVDFAANEKLPRSITDITNRISLQKESARREVLLSHDWNFASRSETVESEERPEEDGKYRNVIPYPHNALRLISVFGNNEKLSAWKIENGEIKATSPITEVKYVRDVADISKWTAFAKDAYIHRLAANVARTVIGNPQDAAIQEQAYLASIENAKLRDTRESNTPNDAWEGNYYVDRMHGRDVRARRP